MACGGALPQDAKYCPTCGVAQTADALERIGDRYVRDEFCEIVRDTSRDSGILTKWAFVARAVGGSGLFEAGRSVAVRRDPRETWDAESEEALNGLISELSADGWHPTGRGEAWFEYRFRREVGYSA
jgi:hypothetical protein